VKTWDKAAALKNQLILEGEAKADKRQQEYEQKDVNILMNDKPSIRLVTYNGVRVWTNQTQWY